MRYFGVRSLRENSAELDFGRFITQIPLDLLSALCSLRTFNSPPFCLTSPLPLVCTVPHSPSLALSHKFFQESVFVFLTLSEQDKLKSSAKTAIRTAQRRAHRIERPKYVCVREKGKAEEKKKGEVSRTGSSMKIYHRM